MFILLLFKQFCFWKTFVREESTLVKTKSFSDMYILDQIVVPNTRAVINISIQQ